jgi:hypothetical protein
MLHRQRIAVLLPLSVLPIFVALSCASELDPAASSRLEGPAREATSVGAADPPACAGNTGAILTTYQGVPFYSNGSCTGTWLGVYQCPDAVKRYSRHQDWHGNASTYCDPEALRERNLIFLPNDGGSKGLDGDIVAFDGPSCGRGVGHVGLRCGTPDAGHWSLCDQNRTSKAGDDPLRLTRTGGALDSFTPHCLVCGASRPGWDFSDTRGLGTGNHGWTLVDMTLVSADPTAIRLDPGDSTPQLLSPSGLRINPDPGAGGYARLHLFLRSSGEIRGLRVHFTTAGDAAWDEAKAQSALIPRSNAWTDVIVELGQNPRWTSGDRIDQIRIDPVKRGYLAFGGGVIDLDWIRFDR